MSVDDTERLVLDFETALQKANDEGMFVPKVELRVLGQTSLLMDSKASKALPLQQTVDFDAQIIAPNAKGRVRSILIEALGKQGLVFDDLSDEIWLPKESKFLPFHDSAHLKVVYLDPISALTSKAIKAKEKNRILVEHGLEEYGEKLRGQIVKYGGDPDYFSVGISRKR